MLKVKVIFSTSAYLCQVGDHVQGDVSVGLMKVATNHIDPRGTVSCVAMRFVKGHNMSQI